LDALRFTTRRRTPSCLVSTDPAPPTRRGGAALLARLITDRLSLFACATQLTRAESELRSVHHNGVYLTYTGEALADLDRRQSKP